VEYVQENYWEARGLGKNCLDVMFAEKSQKSPFDRFNFTSLGSGTQRLMNPQVAFFHHVLN